MCSSAWGYKCYETETWFSTNNLRVNTEETIAVSFHLKQIRLCSRPRVAFKILVIKPTRCTDLSNLFFGIKLYMFQTVHLSIIRSFSLYTQQWYMSYRFADSLRAGSGQRVYMFRTVPLSIVRSFSAGSGRNSILILLASCQQTCMTYTIAVCTVKNSWWWTEKLSETCRVLFQK